MINNPSEYMNFRLGTYSKSEDKKPETEEKKVAGEAQTKTEENKGELKAHSVLGTWLSSFLEPLIGKIEDGNEKASDVALVACALLLTIIDVVESKLGEDVAGYKNDLNVLRDKIKEGKKFDTAEVVEELKRLTACVDGVLSSDSLDEDDKEKIRTTIKVTQDEAKNMGFETGMQSYSRMAAYSKIDVIKAKLYLNGLGWEQINSNTFRVPGTDDVVRIYADGPANDLAADHQSGTGGMVTGIKQSFDEFKSFIDRIISNRIGSYSEDEEFEDAMEFVQERSEKGYSDDEIAEAIDAESSNEMATSSERNKECPECGKDPCECKKSEGELEANCGDFKTRLMNKLGV